MFKMKKWQRKSPPFIHDMLMTNLLKSMSTTVQWLPDVLLWESQHYYEQQLILGTNNRGNCKNHLIIARVRLPTQDAPFDVDSYNSDCGGFGGVDFKIDYEINHNGRVKCARHMPQNKAIIGTISQTTGSVQIFDVNRHSRTYQRPTEVSHEMILRSHGTECFGLSWNSFLAGKVLAADNNNKICLWDLNASTLNQMNPNITFRAHNSFVKDLAWCQNHPATFASVGNDMRLVIWDARSLSPLRSNIIHTAPINCVNFSPFSEFLVATGSLDKSVGVWDSRKLNTMLCCFDAHESGVVRLQWSMLEKTMFATVSCDHRVHLWDLSRVGAPRKKNAKTPPELLFIHAGHDKTVLDISWNTYDRYTIASVTADYRIHFWQMTEYIHVASNEDLIDLITDFKEDFDQEPEIKKRRHTID